MTPCRCPGVLLLLVSLAMFKDAAEQTGRCAGVEGKETVTYHLMPRGMPDNKTHLILEALDQVIVKLFQEGKVDPRAFAGVVFPDERLKAREPAPPVSGFTSTTIGLFPESSSGQHSHYTSGLNFTSLFSPVPISLSPVPTFPFSLLPAVSPPTSSLFRPTSRPPKLPMRNTPNFLAAAKIDSFTLCLWFFMTYIGNFAVVLSYRTHMEGSDTLSLGPQHSIFVMEYMNVTGWELEGHVEPQRWHSACIMRNGTARRASLFLDGAKRLDMDAPEQLYLNGTLVLGNDQDYVGGGFSTAQSAPGLVTGVYLWTRMLSLTEVREVGNCAPPEAALLAWDVTPWRMVGDVLRERVNPCQENNTHTRFLLPIKLNVQKARWFCSGHGLAFPFPTSKAENDEIVSFINMNLTSCSTKYYSGTSAWLDIVYDIVRQRWIGGPDRQPISFSAIREISIKDRLSMVVDSTGEWVFEDESCTVCQGTDIHPQVYIHGLCHKEELTEHYSTLYPRSDKRGIYYLQSFSGLRLHHESGYSWVLYHVPTNTPIAQDNSAEFFWGRKEWQLNGTAAVCGPQRQLFGPHNLTISWCRPGSFTCTSGECVPLTARCSLDPECEDESDEMDCQLVHTPDDYQTYLAPYTPILPLNYTIVLNKLWSVDLMGQLVHVTFHVNLRWRDRRLTFYNLQDNPSLNVISVTHSRFRTPFGPFHGPVWHPQVQFKESKHHGVSHLHPPPPPSTPPLLHFPAHRPPTPHRLLLLLPAAQQLPGPQRHEPHHPARPRRSLLRVSRGPP
ncbi:uncharacterized protein LOC135092408 [Scylla paramamosain]|uniref:uncharacterized protein LOC135092408 n=1 Tax=Scylla paramamosain TaxID=85552 RepID=UPI003082FFCE